MYAVRPPWIYRVLSPAYLLCSLPVKEKEIFLTFDDGPVPEATPDVLSILGQFGVKATFFCVGDNVRRHPDIFNNILADGHCVGNHSFNHISGWKTSPGAYYNNVMRCRDYFDTTLFRPPHGRFTPAQYFILKKDFRFILWSVLTMDYHPKVTPEACLTNATSNLAPGDIIVFHDSVKAREKVLFALPRYLEYVLAKGYSFKLLAEPPKTSQ